MTSCETECCSSLLACFYAKYSCLPMVSIKAILCALDRNAIVDHQFRSDLCCGWSNIALQL